MQRLPKLTAGSATWRLPLAGSTAVGLARAFLDDDAASRLATIADLLAGDPALTLWVACRAPSDDSNSADDIPRLADWFSTHGLSALHWAEDEAGVPLAAEMQQRLGWSELVAASVARARFAAEMSDAANSRQAYLAALLHNANVWLASCGPAIELDIAIDGQNSGRGCLPVWLHRLLRDIRDSGASSFVSLTVACAAGLAKSTAPCSASGKRQTLLSDATADSHAAHGQAAASRWLEADDEATALLPGLMKKLLRLSQLEAEFQRTLETEKLAALKELAYGASHEINNPLANISTRAQTLLREETDPERRRKLAVINSQAFRAHEMISDLMLFARPPALRIEPCDLTGLVDSVIRELAAEAAEQGTELERVTADEPLMIAADRTQLAVAIKAVCTNSLEALGHGGRVEIFVQPGSPAGGEPAAWAEIQITDTGPGILPEVRRHLFDPFFSGREAGRGLGFGLAKCWRIVREHGGRIDVASTPSRGSTFTIRLPRELPQPVRS